MKNIDIKKLYPHPDNPRQAVGDVSELSASIKTNGIMQNLTVIEGGKGVPDGESGYTVIIGHRRLEAAKQAGLSTVPCSIVQMEEKEQIATMLLENMQRSDLTVSEQAHGMQMMFDLGDSEADISDKTGLSVSTVSRRLKIAKLNCDKLKEAENRGGTIEDYLKVAEIKDEKTRNKLLDVIGTNNFAYQMRSAREKQVEKEQMPIIKKAMKKIGAVENENIYSYDSGYETIIQCEIGKFSEEKLPKTLPDKDLAWKVAWGTFYLFKRKQKQKVEGPKLTTKEKAVRKANGTLTKLFRQAFELRRDFVLSFNSAKKYDSILKEWSMDILHKSIVGDIAASRDGRVYDMLGGDSKNMYYFDRVDYIKHEEEHPDSLTLAILLNSCGDWKENEEFKHGYFETMPTASSAKFGLKYIYSWLCKIGYPMSDMEKQLLDGTHPAYKGGETE